MRLWILDTVAWREGTWTMGDPNATAKITLTGVDLAKPGAERSVRTEVIGGVLHIITTEVIDSAPSFSVGAVDQKGTI